MCFHFCIIHDILNKYFSKMIFDTESMALVLWSFNTVNETQDDRLKSIERHWTSSIIKICHSWEFSKNIFHFIINMASITAWQSGPKSIFYHILLIYENVPIPLRRKYFFCLHNLIKTDGVCHTLNIQPRKWKFNFISILIMSITHFNES